MFYRANFSLFQAVWADELPSSWKSAEKTRKSADTIPLSVNTAEPYRGVFDEESVSGYVYDAPFQILNLENSTVQTLQNRIAQNREQSQHREQAQDKELSADKVLNQSSERTQEPDSENENPVQIQERRDIEDNSKGINNNSYLENTESVTMMF